MIEVFVCYLVSYNIEDALSICCMKIIVIFAPTNWFFTFQRMGELDTADLQLPSLQQLLSRLLACQPQRAAGTNCIIQLALSLVAGESTRIFNAINDATFNLVDKFFGMKQHHTLRALDIYWKARQQGLDPRGAESFVKIEQSPSFFLTAMEEFVKGAPRVSTDRREMVLYSNPAPKALLALEYKKTPEVQPPPPLYSSLSKPVKLEMPTYAPTVDLLGPKNTTPIAYTAHVENPLALAFIPSGTQNVTASCVHDKRYHRIGVRPSLNGTALMRMFWKHGECKI
ncbi:putative clathrin assembly protein At5g35200 isoform X2 [Amborella trichopoda]|nr:putative clathrin assembly protein At5g35200 isoform X2 [Amborella trichopoda]|eukprot:XP_020532197.1 putative clathrin assembly protein At5g35200 isoform X2 [Amborella trichopoda]